MRLIPHAVTLAAVCFGACSTPPAVEAPGASRAPLYDNLGTYHYAISTKYPDAQKYFDQGMRLSYAFNHAEAIRAFKQGAAIDPHCAMCFWGVAYALGPNINAPITEDAAKEAWTAIGQARAAASSATDKEKAFIEALSKRYMADPKSDRPPLDKAYAEAMRDLTKRYPDDLEAATLFAQSLMDTAPWNYWDKDGKPRAFTNEVLASLESVLKRQPDHIGAIHLYIHAVEASPDPGRAEPYADKLAALVPGAGHLVHMPGHIYLRTGRYDAASAANDNAVKADEAYFKGDHVAENMMYQIGYYPHNLHFFVTSASMEGRQADALRAAEEVREIMKGDMLRDPAMGGMVQHMNLAPLYTKVRFELWDQVLAEPAPPADLPFLTAIWNTARGLAYASTGKLTEADAALKIVSSLKDHADLKTMMVSSVNSAASIVAIADHVLAGTIGTKRKHADSAARQFSQAAELEDDLIYMEPPDWPIPVHQLQGAALLQLGRAKEAEAAFRADLKKFPDNGWSLSGLQASLEKQGRAQDARDVSRRLAEQWKRADRAVHR